MATCSKNIFKKNYKNINFPLKKMLKLGVDKFMFSEFWLITKKFWKIF